MKQTVFDVLMYMFEHCLQNDDPFDTDPDIMHIRLRSEGFSQAKIEQAFDWLQALDTFPDALAATEPKDAVLRVYHASEIDRIDTKCRGYLLFLEQMGVLDWLSRELVIDRVLALDDANIDLETLKWIILIVLSNRSDEPLTYDTLDNLLREDFANYIN